MRLEVIHVSMQPDFAKENNNSIETVKHQKAYCVFVHIKIKLIIETGMVHVLTLYCPRIEVM